MFKQLSLIVFRQVAFAVLMFLIFLSVLFFFINALPQLPSSQLQFYLGNLDASLMERYGAFLFNILTGQWGVSSFDTPDTPVFNVALDRFSRSFTLYLFVLLISAPLGQWIGRNMDTRTSFKLLPTGIIAFSWPALVFLFLWIFNHKLEFLPRFGLADFVLWKAYPGITINQIGLMVMFAVLGSFALAWGVVVLLERNKHKWYGEHRLFTWSIGVFVFSLSFIGILKLFGQPTTQLAGDLIRHAGLPLIMLTLLMSAAYAFFVKSKFLQPALDQTSHWQPGWSLFVAFSISAQVYMEAVLRWQGLGQSFFKIFVVRIDWPIIVGTFIALVIWAMLIHLGIAIVSKVKPLFPKSAHPLLSTNIAFHASGWRWDLVGRDEKPFFIAKLLLVLLIAISLSHPYLFGMISPLPALPAQLLDSARTTLAFAALAGLTAVLLGSLAAGMIQGLRQLQIGWLIRGALSMSNAMLALPWLPLVTLVLLLVNPPFSTYNPYWFGVGIGLFLWPIPLFLFQVSRTDSTPFQRQRFVKLGLSGFFLAAGIALTLEAVITLIGWHPAPSITWGELINRSYVTAAVRDFGLLFWATSFTLSLSTFTFYLLALELKSHA